MLGLEYENKFRGLSTWAYNFITNKITRSLSIIFVDRNLMPLLALLYIRLYFLKSSSNTLNVRTIFLQVKDNWNKQMGKSVTMVMSNKILSRGHSLFELSDRKRNCCKKSKRTLITLSKLKGKFRTQLTSCKCFYDLLKVNYFNFNWFFFAHLFFSTLLLLFTF